MKKKMMKNFSALITANSSCVFRKKCSKCFGICVCVCVCDARYVVPTRAYEDEDAPFIFPAFHSCHRISVGSQ